MVRAGRGAGEAARPAGRARTARARATAGRPVPEVRRDVCQAAGLLARRAPERRLARADAPSGAPDGAKPAEHSGRHAALLHALCARAERAEPDHEPAPARVRATRPRRAVGGAPGQRARPRERARTRSARRAAAGGRRVHPLHRGAPPRAGPRGVRHAAGGAHGVRAGERPDATVLQATARAQARGHAGGRRGGEPRLAAHGRAGTRAEPRRARALPTEANGTLLRRAPVDHATVRGLLRR